MKFIKYNDNKSVTIPPAVLTVCGLDDEGKLEMAGAKGAVILSKSEMTAMEMVRTILALTDRAGQLMRELTDLCGSCEGCTEGHCTFRDADIEDAIRRSFDGMHLDKDCITPVLDEYGFKRTAWVLANTLHELKWDGRFSYANKHWAEKIYIPTDLNHNSDFVVRSHPAVLDGFASFYRKAVQALNLFGTEHCVGDRAEQDFTGKVLVLSPDTLKESCWSQADQLWYARSGFGCEPHSSGRAVFATCLSDGETARWNREDFIGVLDEKYLPDWAREKLMELTAPRQEEPAAGEMKLE